MGYDVARFQGDVDEDLICPICSGVLEEPVQVGARKSNNQFLSAVVIGEICRGDSVLRFYPRSGKRGWMLNAQPCMCEKRSLMYKCSSDPSDRCLKVAACQNQPNQG